MCMIKYNCVWMPERSKGSDSSSDVVRLVGSNPTPYNILQFNIL